VFAKQLAEIPALLDTLLQTEDLVLISGAGDIGQLAARLPALLDEVRR
jgi:UDP-N-acetylmuramate--alanine ligase